MSGSIAPIQELTPNNHGAVVTVTCFICMFSLVIVTGTRIWITYRRKLSIQNDDIVFALALVFAVAQTACVVKQVNNGLGRHWEKLSTKKRVDFLELAYAAQLVAIFAMAFAKTSVTLLYRRIAPVGYDYLYYLLLVMVGVWTIFSVFAQAFACGLPKPWLHLPSDCSAQFSLDYAIISLNIITDAVLAVLYLPILWKLQTNWRMRVTAMGLFVIRLIVSAAAIAQLVVLIRMPKNSDPSWAMVLKTILDQVVVYLSLITACLPRIYHFIAGLQTGQMGAAVTDRELHSYTKDGSRRSGKSKTKTKSANTSNSDRKSPNIFKSGKSLSKAPQTRSLNQNSQSSLVYQPKHKRSHDTITDCSATTAAEEMPGSVPLKLRPSTEPMNTYDTRIEGGAAVNHRGLQSGEEDEASLKSNVMYETREFQIEYPSNEGEKDHAV